MPYLALALALIAGLLDYRSRRIPNWLSITGLAAGFAGHIYLSGLTGLRTAALGFGVAMLFYLPLFALRAMGGGDVKLMAALGAITGPNAWLILFIFTALLGGIAAIALLLYRGGLGRALGNVGRILASFSRLEAPHAAHPELDVAHPRAVTLPHAVVIALGTAAWFLTQRGS